MKQIDIEALVHGDQIHYKPQVNCYVSLHVYSFAF